MMLPEDIPPAMVGWLDIASQLEDAHEGLVIVNPRNMYAKSLIEIDQEWLAAMSLWRQYVKFFEDYPRRPAAMQ